MKIRELILSFFVFVATLCLSEERSQLPTTVALAFEEKTKVLLEAAKTKDWWGYYDLPRLSLDVIRRSSPAVGAYYDDNPDRLLALQLDALCFVYNMMDHNYSIEDVPLDHQGLLLNGNLHMALLKKQRQTPESLTTQEKEQLKFMREKDLQNYYQTYLALCRKTVHFAGTNTVYMTRLTSTVKTNAMNANLKAAILSTNSIPDVVRIR